MAAEKGNAGAQSRMGAACAGRGDYAEALKWYLKAADQGDPGAAESLGSMYEKGIGVSADYGEAVKWYLKAAEQSDGDAVRLCSLGLRVYALASGHGGDNAGEWYGKAAEMLGKPAENGNPLAQCRLGFMYSMGQGAGRDPKKAAELYRKAADQGNAEAQCRLGAMYEKGRAVPQDADMALELYREAAEHGNADAMCRLGAMYDKGDAVQKDINTAKEWYRKAAESYGAAAGFNINSRRWADQSNKDKGDADAQCRLGGLYYDGQGVDRDFNAAV